MLLPSSEAPLSKGERPSIQIEANCGYEKEQKDVQMNWFLENWFWIVVGLACVGMHLVGHGGHAGHGGDHTTRREQQAQGAARRDETESDGQQH